MRFTNIRMRQRCYDRVRKLADATGKSLMDTLEDAVDVLEDDRGVGVSERVIDRQRARDFKYQGEVLVDKLQKMLVAYGDTLEDRDV